MYFADATIGAVDPDDIPDLFEAILAVRRTRLSRAHAESETAPEVARMLVAARRWRILDSSRPGLWHRDVPDRGRARRSASRPRDGDQRLGGGDRSHRLDLAGIDGMVECVDSLTTPDWVTTEAVVVDPPSGHRLSDHDP